MTARSRGGCSVEGCDRLHKARGYCGAHYKRFLRWGTVEDRPEFVPSVCRADDCPETSVAKGYCYPHYQRICRRPQRLVITYGLTIERWQEILDRQGGRCPVCLTDEPRGGLKGWHVHHDHACCPGTKSCGRCVVAILCVSCNIGIGSLADDPDRLERAAALMRRARRSLEVVNG